MLNILLSPFPMIDMLNEKKILSTFSDKVDKVEKKQEENT